MKKAIQLHDLSFIPFIKSIEIHKRVEELGTKISSDFEAQNPVFIAILNGSFVFAADLIRSISIQSEISFVKLSSYAGTASTHTIVEHIGLHIDIKNRPVIIIEDIIDTGNTLHHFLPVLEKQEPLSINIATLLLKPKALQHPLAIDYVGFEIPDRFVVGYGMDYNGLGRNLKEIYQLKTMEK